MLWSDFVVALGAELAISSTITAPTTNAPSTISDFNTILPRCVEYIENKMLRDGDIDFLEMRTFDATTSTTSGARDQAVPAAIIVPLELNVITPASTAPNSGTRHPVQRISYQFLTTVYPALTTASGVPSYYALTDNNQSNTGYALQAKLAPTPDAIYTLEWYGLYKPTPLSASNAISFLSTNYPDLYLAAGMIFMSGYQRNYGAQSDDPRMAVSWTTIYDDLKRGLTMQEARLKAQAAGWTAYPQTPVATPPRA